MEITAAIEGAFFSFSVLCLAATAERVTRAFQNITHERRAAFELKLRKGRTLWK
jgi:hypothetical protein